MPALRGRGARVVVSGLLVLGLAACGGGGGDGLTADAEMQGTLRYDPNRLEINLNEESTFTFVNRDNEVHNVTVPGLSNDVERNAIEIDVQPGERGTLRLPAVTEKPRDGFFLFYCKFHQTQGMSGRITVSG